MGRQASATIERKLKRFCPKGHDPMPTGHESVALHFGAIAAAVFVRMVRQAWDQIKARDDEDENLEFRIPDNTYLKDKLNVSEQTIITIKRNLEKAKIVVGGSRKHHCRINVSAVLQLSKQRPPKDERNSWEAERGPDGKACKKRSQVVMVRIPGTLKEAPIDDACKEHGGRGAECECPLHRVEAKSAPSDGAKKGTSKPRTKVDFSATKPAPPPNPPPEVSAPVSPAASGDQSISQEELEKVLVPLCADVWQKSPVGGKFPLVWTTGCAMGGWHRPVLPFLVDRIKACKGKRTTMAVLPKLAEEAYADWKAVEAIRVVEAAAAAERDRRQQEEQQAWNADQAAREAVERDVDAAIGAMTTEQRDALIKAAAADLRKGQFSERFTRLPAEMRRQEGEREMRSRMVRERMLALTVGAS